VSDLQAELARIRGLAMPARIVCETRLSNAAMLRAKDAYKRAEALPEPVALRHLEEMRAIGRPCTSGELAARLQQTVTHTGQVLRELKAQGRVTASRRSRHRPFMWVGR
jgi:hypothetical protein